MYKDFVAIFICPRCQQPCLRTPGMGDYEHNCGGTSAAEALKNEDVLVLGAWQDYTGSDTAIRNALTQGQENTLQPGRASIEGEKNWSRTSRGFPLPRSRTRAHIEYLHEDTFTSKGTRTQDVDNYETDGFK